MLRPIAKLGPLHAERKAAEEGEEGYTAGIINIMNLGEKEESEGARDYKDSSLLLLSFPLLLQDLIGKRGERGIILPPPLSLVNLGIFGTFFYLLPPLVDVFNGMLAPPSPHREYKFSRARIRGMSPAVFKV